MKKWVGLLLFLMGVLVVVVTHLLMLFKGLPQGAWMMAHAVANLAGVVLILVGYFGKRK